MIPEMIQVHQAAIARLTELAERHAAEAEALPKLIAEARARSQDEASHARVRELEERLDQVTTWHANALRRAEEAKAKADALSVGAVREALVAARTNIVEDVVPATVTAIDAMIHALRHQIDRTERLGMIATHLPPSAPERRIVYNPRARLAAYIATRLAEVLPGHGFTTNSGLVARGLRDVERQALGGADA